MKKIVTRIVRKRIFIRIIHFGKQAVFQRKTQSIIALPH